MAGEDTETVTSTNIGVWGSWVSADTTSATTDTIWVNWTASATATSNTYSRPAARLSQEQLAAMEEARQAAREAEEERQKKFIEERQASEKRAEILMQEVLSEAEWGEYVQKAQITLITKGTKYRIHKLRAFNIDRLDETDKVIEKLCVVPDNRDIPIQDHMLAQYLALCVNPDETLLKANRRPR